MSVRRVGTSRTVAVPRIRGFSYADLILSKSPFAFYRLGEPNGLMADVSGNSLNGLHTATLTPGLQNTDNDQGLLVASGQYGYVPYASAMNASAALTVCCLAKTTSSNSMMLVERDNSNGSGRCWQFGMTSGKLQFTKVGGTGGIVAAVTTPTYHDGTKRLFAVTYDGTNIRLYVNGVLIGSPTSAAGNLGTGISPLGIAKGWAGTTDNLPSQSPFIGTIDEVALFSSALSASDLLSFWNAAQ